MDEPDNRPRRGAKFLNRDELRATYNTKLSADQSVTRRLAEIRLAALEPLLDTYDDDFILRRSESPA